MSNYNKKSPFFEKKKTHNYCNPFKSTNYKPTLNQKIKPKKFST